MTESWLVWRNELGRHKFLEAKPLNPGEICEYCGGRMTITHPSHGRIRCLCWVKEREAALIKLNRYQSERTPRNLRDIHTWGSNKAIDSIAKMLVAVEDYADDPFGWMTISGQPGTGKTHVLQWLAQQFGPWAMYITDTRFESFVFEYVADNTLQAFLDTIKEVPVLLYDDLGSGYHGGDFSMSAVRRIIDFRYNMPYEYPTVVTTNQKKDQLRLLDSRIADRIMDKDISQYIPLEDVKSWRTQRP